MKEITLDSVRAANRKHMTEMLQTNPTALNYELRNEATSKLKNLIKEIVTLADMDEEKVERRIAATVRSPYGRVPGLLNLLTSIVLWPVDGRDGAAVASLREEILAKLGTSEELLIDLKEAKGYTTFLNDDYEIQPGITPDLEEYEMLATMLAQKLDIAVIDFKLTTERWEALEAKARAEAELEKEEADLELERFKQASA